ncbi:MAG TPA: hypothetical protein VL997_02190, partial [Dyella sp.]|nr:hypothetical protein [Dyella sp.]
QGLQSQRGEIIARLKVEHSKDGAHDRFSFCSLDGETLKNKRARFWRALLRVSCSCFRLHAGPPAVAGIIVGVVIQDRDAIRKGGGVGCCEDGGESDHGPTTSQADAARKL